MVTIRICTRGGKQREYCVRMDQQRDIEWQMPAEQERRVRIEQIHLKGEKDEP